MLRDVASIEHQAASAEIEAAVLEIREIHALRPRYNKRSRPPKSLHWVRLTDERFPRLQLVRTSGRGLIDVGPFRSRRAAEQVQFALWHGSRIRRCGSSADGCSQAHLGQGVCPCSGEISPTEYKEIVSELCDAIERDPTPLWQGLERKMATFSAHERFEDAAAIRDRWDALGRMLEHQRAWRALSDAGTITAVDASGITVRITNGALVATWSQRDQDPLPSPSESRSPSRRLPTNCSP